MQKGQKKCRWNKTRPPWECWLHFCGSQDVGPGGLCVCPGPPFPCHSAGQETLQPWPGAFTAHPLTQETPVRAQQREVTNFKEEEADICTSAWKHRFYRQRRGGDWRLPAHALPLLLPPAAGAQDAGWIGHCWPGPRGILPLPSLFATFCPSFM